MVFGVKASGLRLHIQSFSLETKPKPIKCWGEAGKGGRKAGSPAARLLWLDPQHPHGTVMCTPGLVFSSENGVIISALHILKATSDLCQGPHTNKALI